MYNLINLLAMTCGKTFIGFLLYITVAMPLSAQNLFVGGNVRYGHILCNNAEARANINSPSCGFSVYIADNLTGDEWWHYYWKYPSFGLELSYDYIDNSFTGNKVGALFFIRPSVYKSRHLSADVFLGLGLSYLSKTNSVANPRNVYIGSHINALINLGGQINWFLTDNLALTAGARFSHSSNGQLVRPNLGLNFWQVEVGAEYYWGGYNYDVPVATYGFSKYGAINISFSPGMAESLHNGRHYFASVLSIAYSRSFYPCFSYGVGYDFMYNGTISSALPGANMAAAECFSQGVVANFESRWGRVALRVGVGVYIVNGKYHKQPFYERAGLFYYLGSLQRQYIGVSIKAHAFSAEFIEWTYGISLR